MSYFNKFFGIYGDNKDRFCYVLGKKISLLKTHKPNQNTWISIQDLDDLIQKNISIANQHREIFPKFKNSNLGKDIVIVATGPTVKNFTPFGNKLYLGVNKSYKIENINFDYYFVQDYYAIKDYLEDIVDYQKKTCIKFFGYVCEYGTKGINRVIPESIAIRANALRYYSDCKYRNFRSKFVYDISSQPLGDFTSIIFPAIQFALWTNPRRIYLVGCDCSKNGYFDNSKQDQTYLNTQKWINAYKELKHFADCYYPETEIISVNPVGLKGVFKDLYTQSYVDEHPELLKENIEVYKE